jgi:hypothetical protein
MGAVLEASQMLALGVDQDFSRIGGGSNQENGVDFSP